jgi:hypothetical protein
VTATSWKYTSPIYKTPQNRDIVDPVSGGKEISAPGTYTVHAAVTCGQGDIYASTDVSDTTTVPSMLNPSSVLTVIGPGSPFKETFLSNVAQTLGFTWTNNNGYGTWYQDSLACVPPPTVRVVAGTCSYSNGVSQEDVSLVLDNTSSSSPSTFKVNNGTPITVNAGATLTVDEGPVSSAGTSFSVYINGSTTATVVPVAAFAGCVPPPSCIPDSSVTFSYTNDAANSVTINVPNTPSTSPTLCTPFWVTATSWKFTSPTLKVPQNRDIVDPVSGGQKISAAGQYVLSAAVTCGQGDIYASTEQADTTTFPSMLNPSPVLTAIGPGSPFKETFLSNIAKTLGFTWTNDNGYGTWYQDSLACVPPPVVTAVAGTCTYVNGASQADVSLVLDNTSSSTQSTFKVLSGTNTTYTVAAGTTRTIDVGPVGSAGTNFNVDINGSSTVTVVPVAAFTTCIPVIPGDPLVVQQTCSAGAPVGGSVTVDLDPHLVYTITGPSGFTPVTPTVSPITNQNSGDYTLSGLGAGTYIVSVVPTTGYVLSGQAWWPLTVNMAPISCPTTPVTPTVNLTAATCGGPNPNVPVETEGVISVSLDSNVVYTLTDGTSNPGVILTSADTSEPDGIYTVTASLTPAAVIAGYVFPTGTQTSWPVSFFSACFPTLATWHSGAVGTAPVCTSSDEGTITLLHGPSLTDANSEPGEVNYSIENDATSVVTNVGATTSSVNVAPGDYTVIATPVDPSDGLSGNTGTTNQLVYHVTVAAATTICAVAHALAFTGGSIGVLGFLLAGGMLLLGAGLVLMRRGFGRTAQ